MDENALLHKLFATSHLSVPERKMLPGGVVRASAARDLIRTALRHEGWFPGNTQFAVGDAGGTYLQIESRLPGAVMHRNDEVGYLRYQHSTESIAALDDAVDAYLRYRDGRDLDGLSIDWQT